MSNDKGKLVFGTNNVSSNKHTCHIKLVVSHGIPITVYTNQNNHSGGSMSISGLRYHILLYISYIHYITIPSLVIQCFSYDSSMFCWLLPIDPHISLIKMVVGANPIKSHGKSLITMSVPFPIICPHIFPWFAHSNPHTVSDFPAIHV